MTLLPLLAILVQQVSYFDANFSSRTGLNGYEEYLIAADLLRADARNEIVDAFHNKSLQDARALLSKYPRIIELVRTGNAKTRIPPWTEANISDKGRYPLIELLVPSDILGAVARVRFADGHPKSAVSAMFDIIDYSQRAGGALLIEELTGTTYDMGCVYEALRQGIHKLSLSDCRRLREYFEAAATKVPPVIALARAQLPQTMSDVPNVFKRIKDLDDWGEIPPEMFSLDSSQQEYYTGMIREGLQQYQREIDSMFAEPESNWREISYSDNDPIVQFAVNYLNPFIMWDFAVESRTRLRLAGLHCRVIEYKRRHNKLPSSIENIGSKEVVLDPLTGRPFAYEKLSEQSYNLYSRGSEATGPITLGWEESE